MSTAGPDGLMWQGWRTLIGRPRRVGTVAVIVLMLVVVALLLGGMLREAGRWALSDTDVGWVPGYADGLPYRPPAGVTVRPLGDWDLRSPDRVQIHHDFPRQATDETALAVMLPVVNGDAALFINGVPVEPDAAATVPYLALHEGRPVIWTIPGYFIRSGANRIDVVVTGSGQSPLSAPLMLGPPERVGWLYATLTRTTQPFRTHIPVLGLMAAALALAAAGAMRNPVPWIALSAAAAAIGARVLVTDPVLGLPLEPLAAVLDPFALSATLICLGCAFSTPEPPPTYRLWTGAGAVMFLLLIALALFGTYQGPLVLEITARGLPFLGLAFLVAASVQASSRPSDRAIRTQFVEGAVLGLTGLVALVAVIAASGLAWGLWVPILEVIYGLGTLTLLTGLTGASALLTGRQIWRWVRDRPRLSRIIRSQQQEIDATALALRQQERRSAVLEERQRLSRDMHDGIGGQLTSLLARVRSRGISPEQMESELSKGLAELRLMVDSLDASGGPLADALAVLRTRVRNQTEAAGMTLAWSQSEGLDAIAADPSWVLNLNRMIQEAVTNAVRHSGGTHLRVDIQLTEAGILAVMVQDDGAGFDRDQVRPGRGLANLTFRAAQMSGTIRFARGEAGRGTIVEAVIAVPQPPLAGGG